MVLRLICYQMLWLWFLRVCSWLCSVLVRTPAGGVYIQRSSIDLQSKQIEKKLFRREGDSERSRIKIRHPEDVTGTMPFVYEPC
jgi:hypothetical protein